MKQISQETQQLKQHLEQTKKDLLQSLERLEWEINGKTDIFSGMKNEQHMLKQELASTKIDLVRAETEQKHISDRMNIYKTELQQSHEACEKYRCRSEELQMQLTEATVLLRYLESDYNSALEKQDTKERRRSLGECITFCLLA